MVRARRNTRSALGSDPDALFPLFVLGPRCRDGDVGRFAFFFSSWVHVGSLGGRRHRQHHRVGAVPRPTPQHPCGVAGRIRGSSRGTPASETRKPVRPDFLLFAARSVGGGGRFKWWFRRRAVSGLFLSSSRVCLSGRPRVYAALHEVFRHWRRMYIAQTRGGCVRRAERRHGRPMGRRTGFELVIGQCPWPSIHSLFCDSLTVGGALV